MTDHAASNTGALKCGCYVFMRDGDVIGRALEAAESGEPLRIGRLCPIHGESEFIALVDNTRGGYLMPAGAGG